MKKALLLVAVLCACSPSDRVLPDPFRTDIKQGAHKLSSLDVILGFEEDPNAPGCAPLVDGKLPAADVAGDYCPTHAGTPLEPLLFQTGRKIRVYVTVRAIGTDNNEVPFKVTGPVALSPSFGTVFSGSPVFLENGEAVRQKILLLNTPGHVQVWAEASTAMRRGGLDGERIPPTFLSLIHI